MDTKEIFDRQVEILRRAAPDLFAIHWPTYGSKFAQSDEAGNLQYKALMRCCYTQSAPGSLLTATIGDLTDKDRSFAVLGSKLNALVLNPGSRTSIGLRNPPQVWGGAIRNNLGITGITGLPETGDHLVETYLSWYTEQLTREEFLGMKFGNNAGVSAARELVGMTVTEWRRLSHSINDIILSAAI